MDPYLLVTDVAKNFATGRTAYQALTGVNLSVYRGEFVSLIGHSGCGKSTLLHLIAGLEHPTSGRLMLDGRAITGPGADRGLVFQHHSLLPWLSLRDNVYEAVDAVFPDRPANQKAAEVERVLQVVGLWDHRDKKPHQVSGGMKQRTAVARAFAVHPKVLLLDEPFGAIDALTKSALHDELIQLWSSESNVETVIMVTHDIDEAIYLSDRIVVMTNGPRATIGEIVEVSLPRPRNHRAMVHDPAYLYARDHLLQLLTRPAASAA
jgi:nitrate/nitrite transport system ATP-binding protein